MMRRVSKAAVVMLLLLINSTAWTSSALAEQNPRKLSGAQIRAKFIGMQFTDGVHWGEIYSPNGTLTSTEMGKKRIGTWRLQKDQLCTNLGQEGGSNCYEVWLSGTKAELRLPGADESALEGVLEKPPARP